MGAGVGVGAALLLLLGLHLVHLDIHLGFHLLAHSSQLLLVTLFGDGQCLLDGQLHGGLLLVVLHLPLLSLNLPHTLVGSDLLGHGVVGA